MRWIALIFVLASAPAFADPRGYGAHGAHGGHGRIEHDEARAALESGAIRPLEQILARVRESLPGEIVKVRLERESGRWQYEFRVIDRKGRLREIALDAATGSTIRIEDE
jgi:uncharacterized membrane protein YkoI